MRVQRDGQPVRIVKEAAGGRPAAGDAGAGAASDAAKAGDGAPKKQ
jgi:hypothetical protein